MIKSKNTDTISIRITEKMKEQIENIAIHNNASQSEVVRYAINNLNKK
jgi:Arc/MetJ-type ribon-helix-helix transcriptional regulator